MGTTNQSLSSFSEYTDRSHCSPLTQTPILPIPSSRHSPPSPESIMAKKNRRRDASPSASPRLRRHQILDGGEGADDDDGKGSFADERIVPAADEYATVKLSAVRKEFQCPICLDVIQETRTVKECLHRFCRECIDKSIRLGKNECPTCRTHCASRRSLRDDPSFDSLIAAIYPKSKRYEEEEMTFHEEEKARNKQVQDSIAETLQRQSVASGRKRSLTREIANCRVVKSKINQTSEYKGSDGEGGVDGDFGGKDLSSAENSMNAYGDGIAARSHSMSLDKSSSKLEQDRANLLKEGRTLSAEVTDLVEQAKSASNRILMNNGRLLHLENDTHHEHVGENTLKGMLGDGQSLVSMHQMKILELEKVVELQAAELETAKVELKKNECRLDLLQRDKEDILRGHMVMLDRASAEHAPRFQGSFNKGANKGCEAFLETEQGKAALKLKLDEYLQSAEFKEMMKAERQAGKIEAIQSPELYKLIVQVAIEMKCGAVTEAVDILAPMIPSFDMKNLPKVLSDFYDESGALSCYRNAKKQVLDFGMVEVPESDDEEEN